METIWYLLLTFLLLSIMVVIHELGHFLFAKLFGVTVLEFSIGMGPAIFTTKKKEKKPKKKTGQLGDTFRSYDETTVPMTSSDLPEVTANVTDEKSEIIDGEKKSETKQKTIFSIRAFPIGGFVRMAGEDEASDDKNAFCNKAVWKRFLVTVAGPVMNILLGFLCMFALVGMESVQNGYLASNVVGGFQEISFSDKCDNDSIVNEDHSSCEDHLIVGDKIVKVGNVFTHTGNELVYEIMNHGKTSEEKTVIRDGKEVTVSVTHVDLTVERNGKQMTLKDVEFPAQVEKGVVFGDYDFKILPESAKIGSGNILKHSVFRSFSTIKVVFDSIKDLLTGRYGADSVSGPIGMAGAVGDAAKVGFSSLLYLFTLITMNLGVFNLIPLPALDGGRIIFLGIEAIFRKPIKKEVEGMVNTVGILLLLAVMLFVTIKDIANLF